MTASWKEPGLHEFVAHLRPDGTLVHFYKHPMLVRMCGDSRGNVLGSPENLKLVRLSEDPDGSYHAWLSFANGEFTLIYGSQVQVDICFPYGPESAERSGEGRRVRLRAEILGPAE